MNTIIKNSIKTIAVGVIAIAGHHFGSKLLDHKETIRNNEIDETRHTNLIEKIDITKVLPKHNNNIVKCNIYNRYIYL